MCHRNKNLFLSQKVFELVSMFALDLSSTKPFLCYSKCYIKRTLYQRWRSSDAHHVFVTYNINIISWLLQQCHISIYQIWQPSEFRFYVFFISFNVQFWENKYFETKFWTYKLVLQIILQEFANFFNNKAICIAWRCLF